MRLRTLYVSDEQWEEAREWGEARGVGASEAVRELMRRGIRAQSREGLAPLRRPVAWMTEASAPRKQRHECLGVALDPQRVAEAVRKRSRPRHDREYGDVITGRSDPEREVQRQMRMRAAEQCVGAPCPQAWKLQHGEWLLARVGKRASFDQGEELQEALEAIPGAMQVATAPIERWVAIPRDQHRAVTDLFQQVPGLLFLHTPN